MAHNNTFVKIYLFVKLILIMTRLWNGKNCPAFFQLCWQWARWNPKSAFRPEISTLWLRNFFAGTREWQTLYKQVALLAMYIDATSCAGGFINWALIETENLPKNPLHSQKTT